MCEKVNREIVFSFSSVSLEMLASAVLPTGFLLTVLHWVQRWFCVCVILENNHSMPLPLGKPVQLCGSRKLPGLLLPLPKSYCFKEANDPQLDF